MGPASPAVGTKAPLQCKQTIHKGKYCGVGAPTPSDDSLLSASRPSPANIYNLVVAPQTPSSKVPGKKTTHAGTNSRVDGSSPSDDSLLVYDFNTVPPRSPSFDDDLKIVRKILSG